MKCGICGRELDENGHCIPCEKRAEMNNLREMTLEERLNYQGTTIDADEENSQDPFSQQNQNQFQYKVYTTNSLTGKLMIYLLIIALLMFVFFFVLPVAFAGVVVATIIGFLIGIWRYLTK